MDVSEVAKIVGLPVQLLIRMRARETVSFFSGPPFCKTVDRFGNTRYTYKKQDVLKWLKRRNFRVTAKDAADILGISRIELLTTYKAGVHSWDGKRGKLIITPGKNIYVWMPKLSVDRAA